MNERNLHVLLGRILLATTSLAVGAGCGGTAETDADSTSSGGSTGSGGAASGGAVGAGGSASGGTGGLIEGAGGLIGTGGVWVGTGGVVGTGGTFTAVDCFGPASTLCGGFHVVADASCVAAQTPSTAECEKLCGPNGLTVCSVASSAEGKVTVYCPPSCAIGRRPAGLVPAEMRKNELGEYFARAAYLEAASVRAFRDLRAELHARRAPRSLLRALDRAARDEVRHARSTSALARRFGGRVEAPTTKQVAPRSLEELALENMVEGCVRETYGALTARHQAQAARDAGVRAELTRIAKDETRHAALSWRVQRWLESRLDPAARRRVEEARDAAAAELRAELAGEPASEIVEQAGVPTSAKAQKLFDGLASELWS